MFEFTILKGNLPPTDMFNLSTNFTAKMSPLKTGSIVSFNYEIQNALLGDTVNVGALNGHLIEGAHTVNCALQLQNYLEPMENKCLTFHHPLVL